MEINQIKVLLSYQYAFVLTNKKNIIIFNLENQKSNANEINFKFSEKSELISFSYSNKIVFLNQNSLNDNHILDLSLNKFTSFEKPVNSVYDYIESSGLNYLYFLSKKSLNALNLYELDMDKTDYKLSLITQYSITDDITPSLLKINEFNINKIILNTQEGKFYLFDRERNNPIIKFDQSLSKIQFSEILTYFKQTGKENKKIHYHNKLETILNEKEIPNIFFNTFYILVNDIQELFLRFKDNIEILLNKDLNQTRKLSSVSKSLLIVFTQSEELNIIDGESGQNLFYKTFKNKEILKVKHSDNERFAYIVFKDKKIKNLSSIRLDIDTLEIEEDNLVINDILTDEELNSSSKDLIKSNETNKSVKADKHIRNKYNNKFLIQVNNNSIYGIKLISNTQLDMSVAWNLNMNHSGIKIIDYVLPNVHSNLITTYHAGGKVFYKYIDANLILVLYTYDLKTLIVNVIKINNGKTLHQSLINHVDFSQKITAIFEENFIVINYVKKEKLVTRNEIYTIEVLKREIEHSFLHLLEKIFKISIVTNYEPIEEDVNSIQETDLVFLTQTFILPRRLKKLFVSKTILNVSNKFFIFLFENNQFFVVDKRSISPRRPIAKEEKGKPVTIDPLMNSPYIDPDYPAYSPFVIFDYKHMININFANDQIDNLLIAPTEFESTFIICTEGLNLSCHTVYPDKTFDSLTLAFSYSLIFLFIGMIIVK